MKEKLTSTHLKKSLASHMFWSLHYSVVVDEYNFMDILGVRRNGFAVEFEVKISRSDFMREINLIHGAQPATKNGKDWAKWYKHALYLGKDIKKSEYELRLEKIYSEANMSRNFDENTSFIPNEFNFYVPDYLSEFALSKLANLPYGLVQYGKKQVVHSNGVDSHFYHSDYEIIKKPTKLHQEKNCHKIMEKLAHALTIRSRLLN